MFAKFYEIPSFLFQDIEKPKRHGRTSGRRENSIPPQTQFAGGINIVIKCTIMILNVSVDPNQGLRCLLFHLHLLDASLFGKTTG